MCGLGCLGGVGALGLGLCMVEGSGGSAHRVVGRRVSGFVRGGLGWSRV